MIDLEEMARLNERIDMYGEGGSSGERLSEMLMSERAEILARLKRAEEMEKAASFAEYLDGIVSGLTPDQCSELKGYVHEGGRMKVADELVAKGLLFTWERATPLGGAVSAYMDWKTRHSMSARAALRPQDEAKQEGG